MIKKVQEIVLKDKEFNENKSMLKQRKMIRKK